MVHKTPLFLILLFIFSFSGCSSFMNDTTMPVELNQEAKKILEENKKTWPDSNCSKSDIVIKGKNGDRVWAGCNSTLGTMNSLGVNQYSGICTDYALNETSNIDCKSMISKEDWVGITTNIELAPAHNDNIYGKLYNFKSDIANQNNCTIKNIGLKDKYYLTHIYGGGPNCPCPDGWHVPSEDEWKDLLTSLNDGIDCTNTHCEGLGWGKHQNRDKTNNIVQALGIPFSGFCHNIRGTQNECVGRGQNTDLWASQNGNPFLLSTIHFSIGVPQASISSQVDSFSFPVRCLKDY